MNPLKDTPARITERLTAWGGKNPYGLPIWRVIRAENHLVQRAGTWTEFAEDDVQADFEHLATQDGQHIHTVKTKQLAPTSVKVGMFWVPKWPVKGWILERWFPASAFGSRREWESAKAMDNVTPMMGPYPLEGGYFLLDGPWIEIPNLGEFQRVIAEYENDPGHTHGVMDTDRVERAMEEAVRAQEQRDAADYDRLLEATEYGRRQTVDFVKATPELAAFYQRAGQVESMQLGR